MKVRFGCRFSGKELVVIQISEEIENSGEIANKLKQVLQRENIRRVQNGKEKIAYSITTSEKLGEQFPEVADGSFRLKPEDDAIQEADMGMMFFGSNPIIGVE